MATKYYGIKDNWTDDDVANVIEVASEDGGVSSVKVNGVEYGGGGGGDSIEVIDIEVHNSKTSTQTLANVPFIASDVALVGTTIQMGVSLSAGETKTFKLLKGRYLCMETVSCTGEVSKASYVLTIDGVGTITMT